MLEQHAVYGYGTHRLATGVKIIIILYCGYNNFTVVNRMTSPNPPNILKKELWSQYTLVSEQCLTYIINPPHYNLRYF